jgi:hypothetical protein
MTTKTGTGGTGIFFIFLTHGKHTCMVHKEIPVPPVPDPNWIGFIGVFEPKVAHPICARFPCHPLPINSPWSTPEANFSNRAPETIRRNQPKS